MTVRRAWPAGRNDAAQEMGAPALLMEGLSREAFESLATPILVWSNRQVPQCRLYFFVHEDDMKHFSNFLRAQDFMYNFVDRSDR